MYNSENPEMPVNKSKTVYHRSTMTRIADGSWKPMKRTEAMAIPAIKSYPMPSARELPRNRVPWDPDATRCALLIHDMQRYFLNPFTAGTPPITDLIANIVMLRRWCDSLRIPVFYSVHPGAQSASERGLLRDFWGAGPDAGPDPTGVVDVLAPGDHDTVVWKRRYSAFHRTILLDEIRKRRRDQLIICGVYAHIGCLATALDGFMLDVMPFMVADAMAAFSAEDHFMALGYAARYCASISSMRQIAEVLCPRCKDPGPRALGIPAASDLDESSPGLQREDRKCITPE
jgi:bifunctional isochorismate lyase/aryl carrier protein